MTQPSKIYREINTQCWWGQTDDLQNLAEIAKDLISESIDSTITQNIQIRIQDETWDCESFEQVEILLKQRNYPTQFRIIFWVLPKASYDHRIRVELLSQKGLLKLNQISVVIESNKRIFVDSTVNAYKNAFRDKRPFPYILPIVLSAFLEMGLIGLSILLNNLNIEWINKTKMGIFQWIITLCILGSPFLVAWFIPRFDYVLNEKHFRWYQRRKWVTKPIGALILITVGYYLAKVLSRIHVSSI